MRKERQSDVMDINEITAAWAKILKQPPPDEGWECHIISKNLAKETFDALVSLKAENDSLVLRMEDVRLKSKIKTTLRYYLDTNEEKGVVHIPEFVVSSLIEEITKSGSKE